MSEISPRPWKLKPDGYGNINIFCDHDGNDELIMSFSQYIVPDLCHMINCLNEHDTLVKCVDSLVVEVERLKDMLKATNDALWDADSDVSYDNLYERNKRYLEGG